MEGDRTSYRLFVSRAIGVLTQNHGVKIFCLAKIADADSDMRDAQYFGPRRLLIGPGIRNSKRKHRASAKRIANSELHLYGTLLFFRLRISSSRWRRRCSKPWSVGLE